MRQAIGAVLAVTLLVLGRVPEMERVALASETLYPQNANFKVLYAMARAIQGDAPGALRTLDKIQDQLDAKMFAALRKAMNVLAIGAHPDDGVVRIWIGAVGGNVSDVHRRHRLENLGMHAGPIVAREGASRLLLLGHATRITPCSLQRQDEAAAVRHDVDF